MNESNLHKYQGKGVQHIMANSHCALFLEMGLGKTVTTLTAINKLINEELEVEKVLIVAPKRVVESVWDAECEKWDHLKNLRLSKIVGTPKQRIIALHKEADIYLVSRDNIPWLCGQFGGGMLPFDMLVIDELSSFKNHASQRFKALRLVQPSFHRIVGLTGTPSPNGLIDLWSQMFLLDRGERLGRFIGQYRDNFFKPDKRNGAIIYSYKLQKESEKRIHDKIGDICISMKAEDYLDLPEKNFNVIKIKFPPDMQKMYDDFEEEQVMALLENQDPDKPITAVNAAGLTNKLLQFSNGAVYDEDREVHHIHDLKLEAAKELVEDSDGKPVLIACAYRHDFTRLNKALAKYKPRELKTNADIEAWNRGEIKVLLMHPASGGHGLNLQAGGSTIIWFGLTWSLELYQQLNARLHRQGQTEAVIIHRLLMDKSIDNEVVAALDRKEMSQNGLMEAVKARIEKYISK